MIFYSKDTVMKYRDNEGNIYVPAGELKYLNEYDINIEIKVQPTKDWDESLVKLKSEMDDSDD